MTEGRGETSDADHGGTESPVAKRDTQSPATGESHRRPLNPIEPPWYGPVCPVVWEGRSREAPPLYVRRQPVRDTGASVVRRAVLPPEASTSWDRLLPPAWAQGFGTSCGLDRSSQGSPRPRSPEETHAAPRDT